jgi:hypothetical protein
VSGSLHDLRRLEHREAITPDFATIFAPEDLGARNPLIRRYFLGVFRFAYFVLPKWRAADARNLTHAKLHRNKIIVLLRP